MANLKDGVKRTERDHKTNIIYNNASLFVLIYIKQYLYTVMTQPTLLVSFKEVNKKENGDSLACTRPLFVNARLM